MPSLAQPQPEFDIAALRQSLGGLVGDHEAVERVLGLPSRRYYVPWNASTTYGVNQILNSYCRLHFPGEWPLAGFWSHGWVPSFGMSHPYQVAFQAKPGEFRRNLVPRADMVELLRQHGYSDVQAVGLPFNYLPAAGVTRLPRSVLVAPTHSNPSYSRRRSDLPALQEVLADLKRRFDLVVGCVHSRCLKDGTWLEDFRSAGVPYVSGANMRDANSLHRMRHLFSQFEVVLTNGFGSLIAYASACGAAVAFSDNYVEENRELLLKDYFYARHPEVLDAILEALTEQALRRHCPFLWTKPEQAVPQVEWARRELGYDNRLTPERAVEVFGLRPGVRLGNAAQGAWKKVSYAVKRRVFYRLHSK